MIREFGETTQIDNLIFLKQNHIISFGGNRINCTKWNSPDTECNKHNAVHRDEFDTLIEKLVVNR